MKNLLTKCALLHIMTSIEAVKGYDRNKYRYAECTESCRVVRGAREAYGEYIPEPCTERRFSVGCSGVVSVIRTGVLSDTHRGTLRERHAN